MPGMKRDCGGAAAILGAFKATIKQVRWPFNLIPQQLSCWPHQFPSSRIFNQTPSSVCFRALRITSMQCFASQRMQSGPQPHDLMISTLSTLESKNLSCFKLPWFGMITQTVSNISQAKSTGMNVGCGINMSFVVNVFCFFILKDSGDQQHWCRGQAGAGWWSRICQQRPVSWYYSGHGHTDWSTG